MKAITSRRLPKQKSKMSCFGCKNRELRVLVMGTEKTFTKNLIDEIKKSSECSADCCVNICSSEDDRVSVTIDGLDMVLCDVRTHEDTDDVRKMIEWSQEFISTSASHVFLLVMTQNPAEDKGKDEKKMVIDKEKEMAMAIQETFGDDALNYTIVVFNNVKTDVNTLERSLLDDANELWNLIEKCQKVTYEVKTNVPKDIKEHVKEFNKHGKCYTHKMPKAPSKKGGCRWENFSLRRKVCLLVLCWVGVAVGYFLFCCGKELIETAASAATKRLTNASE